MIIPQRETRKVLKSVHGEDSSTSYGAISRYLDVEGEEYFKRQSVDGFLVAKFNEFVFRPFVSDADDLLDFGCGGGFMLSALTAKTKVGIDINPAARAHGATLGLATYGSVSELKGSTFSKVITCHALEHVPSPHQTLLELRQVLRPDGLLIWLSPMDDWRTKNQRYWKQSDPDMHLYTWTPLLIGNLLASAGYAPRSISVLTHAFPPMFVGRVLWRVSPFLFHLSARVWAVLRRQRQILAVASPT